MQTRFHTPSTDYSLFNYANDTNGDHWDGTIDMNSGTQYNEGNFGCDAAGCHGNNAAHQLSDSGLTVELKDFGAGGGTAPHATDGSFLNPANHGPAAKGLTAAFPNGFVDCQPCHAQAGGPGSNPRFNVGISSAGGVGCEGCHNTNTATQRLGLQICSFGTTTRVTSILTFRIPACVRFVTARHMKVALDQLVPVAIT